MTANGDIILPMCWPFPTTNSLLLAAAYKGGTVRTAQGSGASAGESHRWGVASWGSHPGSQVPESCSHLYLLLCPGGLGDRVGWLGNLRSPTHPGCHHKEPPDTLMPGGDTGEQSPQLSPHHANAPNLHLQKLALGHIKSPLCWKV